MKDRRESPRKNVNWPINIIVDGEIVGGETVDIGADGVHVNFDEPMPMNETIGLTIAPPDRGLIKVTARVIWSSLDGIDTENRSVGMGLCFVEITPADRRYFKDAVSGDLDE